MSIFPQTNNSDVEYSPSSGPEGTDLQWMLAIASQTYGPYSTDNIITMLSDMQIDADTCFAWKEGFDKWALVNEVADFFAKKESTDDIEWTLSVQGETYGPYTMQDILNMISNHQLDSSATYIWNNNLTGWGSFSKC